MRHNHENRTSSGHDETDDSSLDPPTDDTSTDGSLLSKPVFGRRGYLGLLGAGVGLPLLGSRAASGKDHGYGRSEYGLSEYGGGETQASSGSETEQPAEPTEPPTESEADSEADESDAGSLPNVLTVSADREGSSVTLFGLLWTLGGADSASVSFEYRPTGSDSWSATDTETLSGWGAFKQTVSDLPPSTQYEYRSVVTIEGEPTVGETKQFQTLDAENTIFESQ